MFNVAVCVWIQMMLRNLLDAGSEFFIVPITPLGQGHRLKVYNFTMPGW